MKGRSQKKHIKQLKVFDLGKLNGHLGGVREVSVVYHYEPFSIFDSLSICLYYFDKNTN